MTAIYIGVLIIAVGIFWMAGELVKLAEELEGE